MRDILFHNPCETLATTSSTTSSNGSQRFTRIVEQNITHIKTYLIQQKQERYETIREQKKSTDDRPTTSTTLSVTTTCSRQRHSGSNDEDEDTDTESVTSSSSLYEEHKALLRARYSSSMDPAMTAPSSTGDDTTAHGGFRTKFHTTMCTASSFGHLQQQQHPASQTKN